MISAIRDFSEKNITFKQQVSVSKQEEPQQKKHEDDSLLENNFSTRTRIGLDKLTKAFTIYPAKGLSGNRNSNFYEFLTMGIVPYIIGSASLIAIFNAYGSFQHSAKAKAAKLGNKMAMGVILYGIFKELSKTFITYPVKWKTGIDTEIPYVKTNHLLQESPDDYNLTSIEYHKVGESVDFPRWDLLYGDPNKGESINFRYDKIAKKNGLGTDLNDSDQEVKPMYKEVLIKSKLAKSISSFLWAATGVCLAFQEPMEKYFKAATLKFWKTDFYSQFKTFGKSFVESWGTLYKGAANAETKFEKHAGKAMIGLAALSTILGILNTVHITKKPKQVNVIDKNKESVVS